MTTSPPQPPTKSSPLSVSPNTSPERRPKQANPPSHAHGVRFSATTSPMSHSPPHNTSAKTTRQLAAAESSGDEITPIVQRERGNGKGKNYDGTAQDEGIKNNASNAKRRRKAPDKKAPGHEQEDREEEDRKGVLGWLKKVAEKYGSVELDNKGSVARDHLALERTFLAWLRTSLAFASIGIAVTQLFRLNTTISEREGYTPENPDNTFHLKQVGKPLGATFLGIAILVLLLGGRRYFESQFWIIRGKFPASRGSIFLITFVAVALIITSLVVVCVVDPSVFEKK